MHFHTKSTWLQKVVTGRSKHSAWTTVGEGSNLIDTIRKIVERAAELGTNDDNVIAVERAMDEEEFKLERNLDEVDLLEGEDMFEPLQKRPKHDRQKTYCPVSPEWINHPRGRWERKNLPNTRAVLLRPDIHRCQRR